MAQPDKPNWPGLDALRAVAVTLVVLFHSGYAPRGFLGVDIFFVLSGFLITTLLVREYEATGSITLRLFYARRFLRLYPALLLTAAFVVAFSAVTQRSLTDNVHDAVASIFYVANLVPIHGGLLDHTWTLAIEEQFYLVWPLLLILILRVGMRWIYIAATLPVVGLLVLDLVNGRAGDAHSYTRAMGLPLGCALGLASPTWRRRIGLVAIPAALSLVAMAFTHVPFWLLTSWPGSLAAVLTVPVVAALVTGTFAFASTPVLLWVGRRSYGLYLWHFPLLSFAQNHSPHLVPHFARVIAAIVATVVVSALSYAKVERPILRRKELLRPRVPPVATTH